MSSTPSSLKESTVARLLLQSNTSSLRNDVAPCDTEPPLDLSYGRMVGGQNESQLKRKFFDYLSEQTTKKKCRHRDCNFESDDSNSLYRHFQYHRQQQISAPVHAPNILTLPGSASPHPSSGASSPRADTLEDSSTLRNLLRTNDRNIAEQSSSLNKSILRKVNRQMCTQSTAASTPPPSRESSGRSTPVLETKINDVSMSNMRLLSLIATSSYPLNSRDRKNDPRATSGVNTPEPSTEDTENDQSPVYYGKKEEGRFSENESPRKQKEAIPFRTYSIYGASPQTSSYSSDNTDPSSPICFDELSRESYRRSLSNAHVQCNLVDQNILLVAPDSATNDHEKYELFRCNHCGISFDDEVMFSIHMGCHNRSNPFLCNVCGKQLDNKYTFHTHITRGHEFTG